MKYLGAITHDKDIVNKEYVDSKVKPPYSQSFTVGGAYNIFRYRIPFDATYSLDDLLNFNAYAYDLESVYKVIPYNYWWVYKTTVSNVVYWEYFGYLTTAAAYGYTIVFENAFTDTDGTYVGSSSM